MDLLKNYQQYANEYIKNNSKDSLILSQAENQKIISQSSDMIKKKFLNLSIINKKIRYLKSCFSLQQNNSIRQNSNSRQYRLRKSFTTINNKEIKQKLIDDKESITYMKNNEYRDISQIYLKLNLKQKPRVLNYAKKHLRSQTLIYQSTKGSIHFKMNENPSYNISKLPKINKIPIESSQQLLLSTENALSDYYQESIRIQSHIRRRETEENMNYHMYHSLTNKLSTIHENIVNQQSRLSRSYYSL